MLLLHYLVVFGLLIAYKACEGASYSDELFDLLAQLRAQKAASNNVTGDGTLQVAHLIRVPKASSSSLSIVARRLVGCSPPGPCCKYPGDPPGSCPAKGLFNCQTEGKVIGCTHHYPNYEYLMNSKVVSISMMREPVSRAISAYFYPGIHHNSKCKAGQEQCFEEYMDNNRWQNIVVKMMSGAYAYAPEHTCEKESECKRSLQVATRSLDSLLIMGIAEMWELSLFLLHLKLPRFAPLLSEFRIGDAHGSSSSGSSAGSSSNTLMSGVNSNNSSSRSSSISNMSSIGTGKTSDKAGMAAVAVSSRINSNEPYLSFKATAREKFANKLEKQNSLDMQLYRIAIEKLCREMSERDLWKYEVIQRYWKEKSPIKSGLNCSMSA